MNNPANGHEAIV